ncbi:MAG: cytochrome b/b6 domain-containing protein [Acetobacteraceae bacterium]|nr:cytochrome b/b6 domain-containing protein [Acetobacteraceae bacterium]MDW8398755.1 cytochrome b/b6 domain-containing protein [Acetobacteraceae bacterium]
MPDPSPTRIVPIWDPWVRVVHWAIVVLFAVSVASGLAHRLDLHFASGYALLALVLFRIAWGIVGSETARFRSFLRGPRAVLDSLAGFLKRTPDHSPGHSAAGGWSVAALLLLLLAQAGTGLFADDAIFTRGPLARLVPPAVSDTATWLHLRLWMALAAMVALHVLAVALYALLRRTDLIGPMITGRKRLPPGTRPPTMGSPWLAAALMIAAAAAVWGISRLG